MLFGILADVTEESTKLAAEAMNVAHKAEDGILEATGVGGLIPTPFKNFRDQTWSSSHDLTIEAGRHGASLLRTLDTGNNDEDHGEGGEASDTHVSHRKDTLSGPYPDPIDHRDIIYQPVPKAIQYLVDLRPYCPRVYNQGQGMESCTANAVAAAFQYNVSLQRLPHFEPSRLFLWYYARKKSNPGVPSTDNIGCHLRDAIKSLQMQGVCSEDEWPYVEGPWINDLKKKFEKDAKAAQEPPKRTQGHAHDHTLIKFQRVDSTNLKSLNRDLLRALDDGYPFVFGMKTYDLLKEEPVHSTGYGLRLPDAKALKNEEHRHSLLAVGYSLQDKVFIIQNSWGLEFGDQGYFYMPFGYLKHCFDFWVIYAVHSPPERM